jgi:signal transduction histidine kinase/CheY-like chemotaxis protein
MTILLVDDEPQFTQAVGRNLGREGWQVITAQSGTDALRLLEERNDVEVLATDFNMPGMDGAQLVNQALALRPDLYAIVFTGWEDRNYAIRSLRVGADDFIEKDQEFGAKLQQAIRRGFQQVAIDRMGLQLLRAEKEEEVLDLAIHTLGGLRRFDGFCLAAREWTADICRIERAVDLRTGTKVEAHEPLAADSAYRYVIEKEKVFYPPMLPGPPDHALQPYLPGSRSIIVVPVLVGASERGALGIEHHDVDRFKIDDLRFLRRMAHWISLAMENIANLHRVLLERKRSEHEEGLLARTLLHELKNPLNNMYLVAQTETKIEGQDLEDLKKNFARWNQALDRFLRVRASPGEVSGRVDLGEALEEALSRFRIYNPGSSVAVEYEPARALPAIAGNREMLVTAFVNLLQNGAAAAGGGGRLAVRAHFVPLRDRVEIVFNDNGRGIPADEIKRIFEYGYTTRGEGHFGHGLALTQEAVELHGGKVTAESGVGQGATFKVVLPMRGAGPGSPEDARISLEP